MLTVVGFQAVLLQQEICNYTLPSQVSACLSLSLSLSLSPALLIHIPPVSALVHPAHSVRIDQPQVLMSDEYLKSEQPSDKHILSPSASS